MLQEDYLSCKAYENQPLHTNEKDFSAFYDETTEQYFFALLDAQGKVLLISEGYPEQKSRETGMLSVIKNRPLVERYSLLNEGGVYFLSLKAGNHREIARSCTFENEAEAKTLLEILTNQKREETTPITTYEEATPVTNYEEEVKNEAPVVIPTVDSEVEKEDEVVVEIYASNGATDTYAPTEEVLPIEDLLGHQNIWNEHGKTGYAKFQHNNGKFYFVVYNPDGSIYLHSNGYATEADCDKSLEAVINKIEVAESYRIKEDEGVFYTILLDTNGYELARSTAYFTYTDAFMRTPRGRGEAVASNLY